MLQSLLIIHSCVCSFIPRLLRGWSREPGTHWLRMLSYPRISGALETTVLSQLIRPLHVYQHFRFAWSNLFDSIWTNLHAERGVVENKSILASAIANYFYWLFCATKELELTAATVPAGLH